MPDLRTDDLIRDFVVEITGRLKEAAAISGVASELGSKGLDRNAFDMLMKVEPLLHEASVLLSATFVVQRDRQKA